MDEKQLQALANELARNLKPPEDLSVTDSFKLSFAPFSCFQY